MDVVNIENLKKEHGRIFTAKADGMTAYFRKPTRKELSYALTLQSKPLEMTEVLLKQCFVGGDRAMIEETEYLLGCAPIAEKLLEVKQVELGEA